MANPNSMNSAREHCAHLIRLHEFMGNKVAARIARAEWQKIYSWQRNNGLPQL